MVTLDEPPLTRSLVQRRLVIMHLSLEREELPLHDAERHLRLCGGAADDGIERLISQLSLGESLEGGAQGDAVLVVGQCPLETIKVDPDCRGHILPETKQNGILSI